MSKLSFSKELVDAVVRYLVSRPYGEVAELLARLNQEAAPQLRPEVVTNEQQSATSQN